MLRLLLLAALASLGACTSLRDTSTPAPVEERGVPGTAPPTATSPPPGDRPVVGPPLPPDFDPRGSAPPPPSPAAGLLEQVNAAIAAGELDRAAAVAERALRIAPRDPQVWYALANVQFQQRRYPDAEGSAQRALSYASGNARLQREINALLTRIRSAR